uniref:Uncharacterized protein n=1 Tax=Amphora coffeiformis TaxID=265554 RepID=A0A7S3LE47_9STRA|mmetsp:Transcript_15777/g.30064  ORF Transcript_15777/g.30064 Transcript_15777/m.30064 type:complete len:370 (+) Transcript_15777:176-1285(+)|eukprot:scaffold287_cov173-Amphora_coffeaeformis.AAC.26
MPSTPNSLRPLFRSSFTPYLANGKKEKSCCNSFRPFFGCDTALGECSSTLFQLTVVTKEDADEPDTRTAQRILDAVQYQRRDLESIREILPSSPYEGLEFREKLKELDKLGAEIHEAERQYSLLNQYATKKAEHHRLSDVLPHMQAQAEQAGEEKTRKEHQLHRKRLRMQVLEEEASDRQLRREQRAERRHHRELEGVDQERLLPPQQRRGGGMIRRIREVEIPDLKVDIEVLEKDISELERTVEEFRHTRDRVRDLNAYLTQTVPPELDENQEEICRRRLRQIRVGLMERSPRMFKYLLEGKPEDYEQHEKDFDDLYELVDSGSCPCGAPFSAHLVLLTPYPEESDRFEELLSDFAEDNAGDVSAPSI